MVHGASQISELLAQLIRNACVSRPFPDPGGDEHVNAELLRTVLEGPGLELEWIEPEGGRPSLVARIEGHDPAAPSLGLIGHTDVVPASATGWTHDPFGGELIDGEVWGRGAVDMLNQTATMALALRALADDGFRPRGDLLFAAVPDEECGGRLGIKPLIEQYPDRILTDYALTEVGGAVVSRPAGGPLIEAYVADKGMMAVIITCRGTPGHTSLPWGTDNALVRAAEAVRRIDTYRPPTRITDEWRRWVGYQAFDPATTALLLDPEGLWDGLPTLPSDLARHAHACTHCAVTPALIEGGDKINTIPEQVTIGVNLRPCLGEEPEDAVADLRAVLTGVVAPEDVIVLGATPPTSSPVDTPLWTTLEAVARMHHPGATLVPSILPAQTDARWLRPAGAIVYGFGVLSDQVTPAEYWARFHGRDERIDLASLDLSQAGWDQVCRSFW